MLGRLKLELKNLLESSNTGVVGHSKRWTKCYSLEHDSFYFFCYDTSETQWEVPNEPYEIDESVNKFHINTTVESSNTVSVLKDLTNAGSSHVFQSAIASNSRTIEFPSWDTEHSSVCQPPMSSNQYTQNTTMGTNQPQSDLLNVPLYIPPYPSPPDSTFALTAGQYIPQQQQEMVPLAQHRWNEYLDARPKSDEIAIMSNPTCQSGQHYTPAFHSEEPYISPLSSPENILRLTEMVIH